MDRLAKRPLKETEFVAALSRCMVTYKDDDKKFRAFTGDITGLATRRDEINAKKKGDDGGGDGKKKGGKKKKK